MRLLLSLLRNRSISSLLLHDITNRHKDTRMRAQMERSSIMISMHSKRSRLSFSLGRCARIKMEVGMGVLYLEGEYQEFRKVHYTAGSVH